MPTWDTAGWFGTDVLWLSPRPAEPFTALTSAVLSAFPAYPPYGGEYDDVVPHLTVGHGVEGSNLRDVERQVLPHLPIHMEVTTAGLWVGSDAPGSWAQVAALPLG
jgi:hypothetical protein